LERRLLILLNMENYTLATIVLSLVACSAGVENSEPNKPNEQPAPATESSRESAAKQPEAYDPNQVYAKASGEALQFGVNEFADVDMEKPFAFVLPEGAMGFNIVAVTNSASQAITNVWSPKGEQVRDVAMSKSSGLFSADGLVGAGVPTSDAFGSDALPSGEWRAEFKKKSGHARVVVSLNGAAAADAKLDLVMFIPDNIAFEEEHITAATAEGNPAMKERLAFFYEGLKSHFKIGRGQVQLWQSRRGLQVSIPTRISLPPTRLPPSPPIPMHCR
jgi:hypothetical protein